MKKLTAVAIALLVATQANAAEVFDILLAVNDEDSYCG